MISACRLLFEYKFTPDTMVDAYDTIESSTTRAELNPRELIPAMM